MGNNFNFNSITLGSPADISKVGENFDIIETSAVPRAEMLIAVNKKVLFENASPQASVTISTPIVDGKQYRVRVQLVMGSTTVRADFPFVSYTPSGGDYRAWNTTIGTLSFGGAVQVGNPNYAISAPLLRLEFAIAVYVDRFTLSNPRVYFSGWNTQSSPNPVGYAQFYIDGGITGVYSE